VIEGLLLAVVTGLMWTGIGAVYSRVAREGHDIISFQMVAGGLISVMAWWLCDWPTILAGPVPHLRPLAVNMAFAGVVGAAAMMVLMSAMRRGHHAVTWTVSQSALVLPFLAGIFIWHDAARPTGTAGVAAVLVSLVLLGVSRSKQGQDGSGGWVSVWLVLTVLAFVLIGCQQTICTIPNRWPGFHDAGRMRVALGSTSSAVFLAVVNLLRRRWPEREVLALCVLCALFGITGAVTLFAALDFMQKVGQVAIVFPLCVGVCVVGFSLYSRAWLKERLGLVGAVGLALSVLGIVLMGL